MAIEKIQRIEGRGLPLPGDNIDTDRIIPARFLRSITFEGLENHLFEDDRQQLAAAGSTHPVAEKKYAGATVLLVNANFGCGSSRNTRRRRSGDTGSAPSSASRTRRSSLATPSRSGCRA